MSNSRRPRVIAAIVIGSTATLTFGTGVAYAALKSPTHRSDTASSAVADSSASPAPSPTMSVPLTPTPVASTPAPVTATTAPLVVAPAASSTVTKPAAAQVVTYVVKPGDNLSIIAAWFKLHGYTGLYQANLKVIGADPNLIHPGERLVLGDGPIVWRTAK